MSTKSGDTLSSGSSRVGTPVTSSCLPSSSSAGQALDSKLADKRTEATEPSALVGDACKHSSLHDTFFDGYWSELAAFSFDRAKEIVDKEKEAALRACVGQNIIASPGFTWVVLTTALSQITSTEKAYLNLVFLAPKGFLRKDCNLKSTLESIKHDLKKIADAGITDSSHSHRRQNSKIASAILMLVALRLDMMEFYEKLSLLGTAKNVEISDLLCDVEVIYEKFNDEKIAMKEESCILNGIINSLVWECESLINLLKSHMMMQTWEYLQATVALQAANNNLVEWDEFLQSKEASKKSHFYKSGGTQPALYTWILRLKGALVSKFTIYFYEILTQTSGSPEVVRNHSANLPNDYFYKITVFKKKSDALFICIVFDAKDTNFHPSGYQHCQRPINVPQGLDTYPAIFALPEKPVTHWPSVVMLLSGRFEDLTSDKFIGFYDKTAQSTYFLLRIDVRMFMLVIYDSKKSEKDSYTQKFMSEMAVDLKCSKIFSSLKSVK